jgi:hypothetical protein
MTDYRYKPGSFTQNPRGANGLLGRTAVDMRLRRWGDFEAVSQGAVGYWRFRCAQGHEELIHGGKVRAEDRAGKQQRCAECAKVRSA